VTTVAAAWCLYSYEPFSDHFALCPQSTSPVFGAKNGYFANGQNIVWQFTVQLGMVDMERNLP